MSRQRKPRVTGNMCQEHKHITYGEREESWWAHLKEWTVKIRIWQSYTHEGFNLQQRQMHYSNRAKASDSDGSCVPWSQSQTTVQPWWVSSQSPWWGTGFRFCAVSCRKCSKQLHLHGRLERDANHQRRVYLFNSIHKVQKRKYAHAIKSQHGRPLRLMCLLTEPKSLSCFREKACKCKQTSNKRPTTLT